MTMPLSLWRYRYRSVLAVLLLPSPMFVLVGCTMRDFVSGLPKEH